MGGTNYNPRIVSIGSPKPPASPAPPPPRRSADVAPGPLPRPPSLGPRAAPAPPTAPTSLPILRTAGSALHVAASLLALVLASWTALRGGDHAPKPDVPPTPAPTPGPPPSPVPARDEVGESARRYLATFAEANRKVADEIASGRLATLAAVRSAIQAARADDVSALGKAQDDALKAATDGSGAVVDFKKAADVFRRTADGADAAVRKN